MLLKYYNLENKKSLFWGLFIFVITFFANLQFSHAQVLNPQADYYRSQGLQLQQSGRYQEALNFYIKAATMGQESVVLDNDIGIIYEQLNMPDRAQEYYLRALKSNPDYLPVYSNLAYLYKSQGDKNKAKQFFYERLKRSGPDDPWRNKIREELYDLDPEYKANAVRLELQEKERRLEVERKQKAELEFNVSLERAQKHIKLAEKLLAAKKFDEAIAEYDNALKVTPDNPIILKAREQAQHKERIDEINQRISFATQKLNSGEVDTAKKELQKVLAIIPKANN